MMEWSFQLKNNKAEVFPFSFVQLTAALKMYNSKNVPLDWGLCGFKGSSL